MQPVARNAIDLSDVTVLCDGESDRRLFVQLKGYDSALKNIPTSNVTTYEQARHSKSYSALDAATRPLHEDDRPDYIICIGDEPVLVIEMTQHAYTGDNGLQRFARFAAAAENGVPFIYFGPKARVRDDELDGDGKANPRSLTSDLFEGMKQLATVHGTPQLYVEWKVDRSGLPSALPAAPTAVDVRSLYGELLDVTVQVLAAQATTCGKRRLLSNPVMASLQEATNALADVNNTFTSQVKLATSSKDMKDAILNPSHFEGFMIDNDYFNRGKADKLLALFALRRACVTTVQLPDESILHGQQAVDELRSILDNVVRFAHPGIAYYTGYKWRPDPHSGVLVNVDYRLCRQPGELTPADRTTPLVVFYPRVSINRHSTVADELRSISRDNPGAIKELFQSRYPLDWESKMTCLESPNLFSTWSNRSKQARIFRRYADLIVLNDGVVVGDALASAWPKT